MANSLKTEAARVEELLPLFAERLACPSLDLRVSADWSSVTHQNRLEIRKALSQRIGEDVTDLLQPPLSSAYSISISHSPSLGGYALAERPWSVGFDLEKASRPQERIVARVSSPEEMRKAPSPAALWCAKEAVFKSFLGSRQPQVLSEIVIQTWSRENLNSLSNGQMITVWAFAAGLKGSNLLISGEGLVFSFGDEILSIFAQASST